MKTTVVKKLHVYVQKYCNTDDILTFVMQLQGVSYIISKLIFG